MRYKQKNPERREFLMHIIIAVMIGIIVAQTIITVVLYTSLSGTKAMYDEAQSDRLEMQEEINRLTKGKTEVGDNYNDGDSGIPYVTRGGDLIEKDD